MISLLSTVVLFLEFFHVISSNCLSGVKVYGPGWDDPSLVLPSRYFFVEYPEKCHRKISKVIIESLKEDKVCRNKQQIFHDTFYKVGLTLVRYRLLDKVCEDGLRVMLLDENGQEVKRIESKQVIGDEDCVCPQSDFDQRMECDTTPELYQRIDDDLRSVFKIRNYRLIIQNM